MQYSRFQLYLTVINRAGGLFGESNDLGRVYRPNAVRSVHTPNARSLDSPIQNDQARLIRCLLYGKQVRFHSLNVTGLGVQSDIFLANSDEWR